MKLEEYVKNLDKFRSKLPAWLFQVLQQYASLYAVADISQRVVQRQISHKGTSFSKYSTKPYYTTGRDERSDKVYKALAGTKAQRKNLKWITVKENGVNVHKFLLKGGYQQFREIYGYSNTRKSFELSTQMWRHFGVKKSIKKANEIIITIGGTNREAQAKIDENSAREGMSIIGLTQKEQEELEIYVDKQMLKLLKQYKVA